MYLRNSVYHLVSKILWQFAFIFFNSTLIFKTKNTISLLPENVVYSAGRIEWFIRVSFKSCVFITLTLPNSSTSCLYIITDQIDCEVTLMLVGKVFWPTILIMTGIFIKQVFLVITSKWSWYLLKGYISLDGLDVVILN